MKLLNSNAYFQAITLLALGAFSVLGFAPFYIYPAVILSLIGLIYFWFKAETPKQAAKFGFIYGLGFYGAGIYWIYISLHTFGNMPWWMAGICTFLLCTFMAMFIAMVGALSVRFSAKNNLHLIITIAVFCALPPHLHALPRVDVRLGHRHRHTPYYHYFFHLWIQRAT